MAEVRCDQCGRLLTLSEMRAGVCPSCGRPIAQAAGAADLEAAGIATDDDSGTRPMSPALFSSSASTPPPQPTAPPPPPADALTAPATPIPPYRPPALPRATAGATPSTTADAVTPANERTAALPAHLLPSEADIVASGAAPATGSMRKGRRSGWISAFALLIVLVLGAIALLLAANGQLGGILGTSAATPTAMPSATPTAGPPPAPAGFARFTTPSFSIIYPTGWNLTGRSGGLAAFTNPNVTANLIVQTSSPSDPASLDDVFIGGLGPFLLNKAPGTSLISNKAAPVPTTVAGMAWTREEADVTVTTGVTTTQYHVAALAVTHNQQSYLIGFYAPASVFAVQDSSFFEPMVNSFLLISAQP